MKHRVVALWLALCAGHALAAEVLPAGDAGTLLKKIAAASRKLSYVGTYLHQHGLEVSTFRVAHVVDAEGELEYFLGSQVELPQDAPGPSASRHDKAVKLVNALTPRQREVLEHMAMGKLNKQIAYDLGLSEQTVKMQRAALLDRLGAATTADAIRIAVEANISAPAQA